MSEFITDNGSWDEDFKTKEQIAGEAAESKRLDWIRFDKPGEYRVRLCGNFVRFYRWWSPFATRLITHLSYKDEDPAWNAGFWPRKTFAIHVIDRGDVDDQHPTGKLKLLEKGASIFEAFANYNRINKVNPASQAGPDFVIEVEWPNGNKRQANYKVTPVMQVSEWTDQEIEMIKSDHADLKKIYAPSPLEDIKSAWDMLPDDAKIPPKRDGDGYSDDTTKVAQASTKTTSPEPTPEIKEAKTASSDDDLFGDDDSVDF
jgi:hypothetical protein